MPRYREVAQRPSMNVMVSPFGDPRRDFDDGDACSVGDTCDTGVCQSTGPADCDDADECTADSCDEVLGCGHDPIVGCPPAVPMLGGRGWLLLAGLILTLGTLRVASLRRGGA